MNSDTCATTSVGVSRPFGWEDDGSLLFDFGRVVDQVCWVVGDTMTSGGGMAAWWSSIWIGRWPSVLGGRRHEVVPLKEKGRTSWW